jgi:hypothetical protein
MDMLFTAGWLDWGGTAGKFILDGFLLKISKRSISQA